MSEPHVFVVEEMFQGRLYHDFHDFIEENEDLVSLDKRVTLHMTYDRRSDQQTNWILQYSKPPVFFLQPNRSFRLVNFLINYFFKNF